MPSLGKLNLDEYKFFKIHVNVFGKPFFSLSIGIVFMYILNKSFLLSLQQKRYYVKEVFYEKWANHDAESIKLLHFELIIIH